MRSGIWAVWKVWIDLDSRPGVAITIGSWASLSLSSSLSEEEEEGRKGLMVR